MENDPADLSSIELLANTQDNRSADGSNTEAELIRIKGRRPRHSEDELLRWDGKEADPHPWKVFYYKHNKLINLALVLLNLLPVGLLAAYAPRLSTYLGSLACLPNGNFILPGTADIWNPDYFFTVSITWGQNHQWSYTHVKIIDVVWDVVVGRGGQILLVYISYHVFNQSLSQIMQSRPVSYQTYGAVAFQTGSVNSMWQYVRAVGSQRFRPSARGFCVFGTMALTTLYVVSMPTLYSAMTGYAALAAPSIELGDNCPVLGNCSIHPCGGPGSPANGLSGNGFNAGWGYCLDPMRFYYGPPYLIATNDPEDPVRQYYDKYKADYEAAASDPRCLGNSTRATCPPLAKSSVLTQDGVKIKDLGPPLLNIQLFPADTWLCGDLIVHTSDLLADDATGICTAGSQYQWGFSFLLLFLVCILQFIWAAAMYALWIDVQRNSDKSGADRDTAFTVEAAMRPTLLKSAIAIASQAEQQYGAEVKGWTSRKLERVVWRGKKGIHVTEEY